MDDQPTYDMLARGDTLGVFQFESSGMRDALRQVKPTSFDDLVALVALYRPGPMQNIPLYARRKNGQEQTTYLHPKLEAMLGTTMGITVFQEQSMQIAKDIAGFTPAEADDLRKAIGKKVRALMARSSRSSSRAAPGTASRPRWPEPLGRQRALRRLLVQQGARGLLRADRLPDGLPQGELPRAPTWRR